MDMKEPTEQELRDFLRQKYLEDQIKDEVAGYSKSKEKVIERYRDRLMKVNAELFFKFLADKGVSRRCIACGSDALSVPQAVQIKSDGLPENYEQLSQLEQGKFIDAVSTTYVQYVSFEGTNDPNGLIKSYYTVHCANCGNLTLYRASTVLKWLESQKNNVEVEDE